MIKISTLKPNPNNPRLIKDGRFNKLIQSIKEFPSMMELRPMVVKDGMLLGGNMRLKAIQEIGMKEIPESWVKDATTLTEDEVRRFIIADNVGFGEHDWELLANEWDTDDLEKWGLELPVFKNDDPKDKSDQINSVFKIEIECESEREQEQVYDELTKKGFKCKILTL